MLQQPTRNEVLTDNTGLDVAQAGAICYRRNANGRLEVLLVGSRRNGRWGVPKGHIESRETSSAAALREAFEEAGIIGDVDSTPVGSFTYQKDSSVNRYTVAVHLLKVLRIAVAFPEAGLRKTQWFRLKDASREAAQPGLRTLLSRLETMGV
ncbi:NUDIX hydrolase [Rhizobium lentis]|uniref:NUDIX hydrolase n=1 Tax=Rhizobium lentis TaxID=1138194 RepID=UPI001A932DD0|nr:NUDIX hydrolase [Rhizobium lentis]MBX4998692.1 NUDIX hydrolase [Rhizobium lentis]MBX5017601.1 NUDIX hydrolase [Rhizobium lentis]MBX5068722.1 NUDIX hydrolase [Rhizobium lentis]MBX5076921.1 NUDIX hydrolase [Rhizobium lentis]QSW96141.1 NUDIX hydrolase [Rhizobium lentis]